MRRVAREQEMGGARNARCDMVVCSLLRTVWPKSVCDVAVPRSFGEKRVCASYVAGCVVVAC